MTDYLRDPNRLAPCQAYEASDERADAILAGLPLIPLHLRDLPAEGTE